MTSGRLSEQIIPRRETGYDLRSSLGDMYRSRSRNQERVPPLNERGVPYTVQAPNEFQLERFAHQDNLFEAWRILERSGGNSPGENGVTYRDLSGPELFESLRAHRNLLQQRRYRPQKLRQSRISKPDGGFRTIDLLTVEDRTIAKTLLKTLEPFLKSVLPSYGRDVLRLYLDLQTRISESGNFYFVARDIKQCFPNVILADVFDCYRQYFSQPDLLWLIETVVRGHEGPRRNRGLFQGSPFSPVSLELLLRNRLDILLETDFPRDFSLFRYVDNINMLVRDESEGFRAIERCQRHLSALRLELKEEAAPLDKPMDLRERDERRAVLGLIPWWENGVLCFQIPKSAFDDLKEALQLAAERSSSLKQAEGIVNGWLNVKCPALTPSATPEIVSQISAILSKCGFYEIRRDSLMKSANQATKKWSTLCDYSHS